jgi:subtilisin family serine protease
MKACAARPRFGSVQCPPALFAPLALLLAVPAGAAAPGPRGEVGVAFATRSALVRYAAAADGRVVRVLPAIHVAVVAGDAARLLRPAPGIAAAPLRARSSAAEPSLAPDPAAAAPGASYEWQYAATHMDAVPSWVARAAASVPVAVVDTGADLAAPDLAAKRPLAHSVLGDARGVTDSNGHGTFVASIAAGSPDNGDGMAGFGGDAPLLVVQAGSRSGAFTEVDEAAAIVWAVDRGARVVNLSLGGPASSPAEARAVAYAVAHDVLLVAAAGNEQAVGNPVEYPAALLQPVGSDGVGGAGLAVGGSAADGSRAWFSGSGSWLSLVAPAERVLGAVAPGSSPAEYTRVVLPEAHAGLYGVASGTSFAAPQVAGVAALVRAANPALRAAQVADILERTAAGGGAWNADTGFGVLDAGAAVAAATAALPDGEGASWILAGAHEHVLRARLAASTDAPLGGRALVLDRASGSRWRVVGTRRTDARGAAAWTLRAGGRYRVRFAGAADLTAATSVRVGPLTLR